MSDTPTAVHVQSWTKTTYHLDKVAKEELKRALKRIFGQKTGSITINLSQGGIGSIEIEEVYDGEPR